MNWRKILIGLLAVAFAVECLYPIGGFLFPEKTLELFGMPANPDTRFLAFVLTWCLLFVAAACGLALWQVAKDVPAGWQLSLVLGYWWIAIGIALAIAYGRTDNLFLDSLKGGLIVIAAHLSGPGRG